MSEKLKPCPFCGAKPHRQLGKIWRDSLHGDAHQDTVIKCPHLCVTMQGSEDSVVERWNTRADLMPVVKPLVWGQVSEHVHEAAGVNGGYRFAELSDGTARWKDRRYRDWYEAVWPEEAKSDAFHRHEFECNKLFIGDMIDPAALVAGAYKAIRKVMGDYHWNRYASREEGGKLHHPAVFSSHTYQDVQDLIDALTPANAQDALDAAIAKAVNAKLTEVHCKVRSMVTSDMGVDSLVRWSLEQIADTILAMKEPE